MKRINVNHPTLRESSGGFNPPKTKVRVAKTEDAFKEIDSQSKVE